MASLLLLNTHWTTDLPSCFPFEQMRAILPSSQSHISPSAHSQGAQQAAHPACSSQTASHCHGSAWHHTSPQSKPCTKPWQVLQEAISSHQLTVQCAGCHNGTLWLHCSPATCLSSYVTGPVRRWPSELQAYHVACSFCKLGKSPAGYQCLTSSFLPWGKVVGGTCTRQHCTWATSLLHWPWTESQTEGPGGWCPVPVSSMAVRCRILHFYLPLLHKAFILHFAPFSAKE